MDLRLSLETSFDDLDDDVVLPTLAVAFGKERKAAIRNFLRDQFILDGLEKDFNLAVSSGGILSSNDMGLELENSDGARLFFEDESEKTTIAGPDKLELELKRSGDLCVDMTTIPIEAAISFSQEVPTPKKTRSDASSNLLIATSNHFGSQAVITKPGTTSDDNTINRTTIASMPAYQTDHNLRSILSARGNIDESVANSEGLAEKERLARGGFVTAYIHQDFGGVWKVYDADAYRKRLKKLTKAMHKRMEQRRTQQDKTIDVASERKEEQDLTQYGFILLHVQQTPDRSWSTYDAKQRITEVHPTVPPKESEDCVGELDILGTHEHTGMDKKCQLPSSTAFDLPMEPYSNDLLPHEFQSSRIEPLYEDDTIHRISPAHAASPSADLGYSLRDRTHEWTAQFSNEPAIGSEHINQFPACVLKYGMIKEEWSKHRQWINDLRDEEAKAASKVKKEAKRQELAQQEAKRKELAQRKAVVKVCTGNMVNFKKTKKRAIEVEESSEHSFQLKSPDTTKPPSSALQLIARPQGLQKTPARNSSTDSKVGADRVEGAIITCDTKPDICLLNTKDIQQTITSALGVAIASMGDFEARKRRADELSTYFKSKNRRTQQEDIVEQGLISSQLYKNNFIRIPANNQIKVSKEGIGHLRVITHVQYVRADSSGYYVIFGETESERLRSNLCFDRCKKERLCGSYFNMEIYGLRGVLHARHFVSESNLLRNRQKLG